MPNSSMSDNKNYPLSFLFVLITISAVGMSMFASLTAESLSEVDDVESFAGAALLGGGVGGILGILLGCYHVHRRTGVLVGGTLGAVLGAAVFFLWFVDPGSFSHLVVTQLAGAAGIVFLAAILRFGLRKEMD